MAKKRRRSHQARPQGVTRSVPTQTTFATFRAPSATTYQAPAPHQVRGPLVTRPASLKSEAAPAARARAPGKLAKLLEHHPNALICAKRHIRKQVLHALGKAGKRGQRRPRFTLSSKVKCP